jgi:hypothetical protein
VGLVLDLEEEVEMLGRVRADSRQKSRSKSMEQAAPLTVNAEGI